jgi:hypothetical protein
MASIGTTYGSACKRQTSCNVADQSVGCPLITKTRDACPLGEEFLESDRERHISNGEN